MNNSIKKQLKKMRVSPLTRQEKDAVWKQVCLGISATDIITARKSRVSSIFKRSIAITLIFGMTMGTASAANEAKPGDFLFPLDRAIEDAHLSLVSGEKKDELKVKFALERVEEVKEIFSEISTKTKIKKAEEELETPPEKVEENTEEDVTPLEPLPDMGVAQTSETPEVEAGEEENVQEDSETNSSDGDVTETADTDEQVGSSDDDPPVDLPAQAGGEADTASSSKQENLENKKTEVADDISSQNGSTTEDVSTDQEQEVPKTNESGVEMSDADKKRVELALETALNFLSDVKGELAEQGNVEAASAIDNLLKDLNDEIETLPENITFEVKLSPSKQKVQFEITSEDDKDVVQIVEKPTDENDGESGVIERLDEVPAEPKETKLEIKDGTLSIKTDGEDNLSEEEKVAKEETDSPADGSEEDATLDESCDEETVEKLSEKDSLESGEDADPASAENSGEAKQKQPTTTDDVLNNNEDEDSVPTADTAPADGEDDGTTTVKVIIKKLDENFNLSVTDQDGDLHNIIEEYTDEKGDT